MLFACLYHMYIYIYIPRIYTCVCVNYVYKHTYVYILVAIAYMCIYYDIQSAVCLIFVLCNWICTLRHWRSKKEIMTGEIELPTSLLLVLLFIGE